MRRRATGAASLAYQPRSLSATLAANVTASSTSGPISTSCPDGEWGATRSRAARYDRTMATLDDPSARWNCAFCGARAIDAPDHRQWAIVSTHRCVCGAVGMCAPSIDYDEITDAAFGHFAVAPRPESRGFESRLLDDLRAAGVEMREGVTIRTADHAWGLIRHEWFRRRA